MWLGGYRSFFSVFCWVQDHAGSRIRMNREVTTFVDT